VGALLLTLRMRPDAPPAGAGAGARPPGLPIDVLKDAAVWRFMLFVTLLAAFASGCSIGITYARNNPKKKARHAR
jgi:hypothetical protein